LILADTDVLIDYLAGVEPTTGQVRAYLDADQLQMSAVTCFELLSGAKAGKRGAAVRTLIAAVPVVPLDRAAAEPDRHG
jgi:predicted nucleic acid-binding protein